MLCDLLILRLEYFMTSWSPPALWPHSPLMEVPKPSVRLLLSFFPRPRPMLG